MPTRWTTLCQIIVNIAMTLYLHTCMFIVLVEADKICYFPGRGKAACTNDTAGLSGCSFRTVRGFVKQVCEYQGRRVIKCPYAEVYYQVRDRDGTGTTAQTHTTICPHDPQSYQVCGLVNPSKHKFGTFHLCEHFVCKGISFAAFLFDNESGNFVSGMVQCNDREDCLGGVDEAGCGWVKEHDPIRCIPNRNYIPRSKVCNGIYDCAGKNDELESCNHPTGLVCDTNYQKGIWVHPAFICSLYSNNVPCLNGENKANCSDYTGGRMCQYGYSQARYIKPYQMCHPTIGKDFLDYAVCTDGRDQLNCSDVALSCLMDGYPTNVSRWGTCRHYQLCDDNFDDACYLVEHDCNLHKHQLCDKQFDCPGRVDELNSICEELTQVSCVRRAHFNKRESLPIPNRWLCDGVWDCEDGTDEDMSRWKICGTDRTKIRCKEHHDRCRELFKCPNTRKKFAELSALCNYIEDCRGEKLICRQSRQLAYVFDKAVVYQSRTILSVTCLPGVHGNSDCITTPYKSRKERLLGVASLNLTYQPSKTSCKYVYGELYVLKACSELCQDASCPIKPLSYSACPYLKNRAITLVGGINESHNLTIVERIEKIKGYSDRLFECDNGHCIPYKQVCNLANDCGDSSDERDCVNNFKCHSSDYFIALSAICDGRMDCNDSSDECNELCTCTIIESYVLKITTWIFGVTATFINLVLIIRKAYALREIRTKASLYNGLFVISISTGDMCVGVYLLGISVANAVFSGGRFCVNRYTWLNSTSCVVLGILSSFGSLLSLFTMTLLSLYRCYSLKNVFASRSLTRSGVAGIAFLVTALLFSALFISIIPVLPNYEDYFLNGIYYEENPLFVDAPSKNRHIMILEAYYGRLTHRLLSWQVIRELIADMFTRDIHGVYGSDRSFYGNSGVCMFKYFVKRSDPQHVFSLVILALNTLLCILIAFSYTAIYILSRGGISKDRQSHTLERKISLIILTDSLSWIPFTLLCLLHYLEIFDGTPHYELFSLLIIPVNSVINPLIYDDIVSYVVMTTYRKFKGHVISHTRHEGVSTSTNVGGPRTQWINMKAITSPDRSTSN